MMSLTLSRRALIRLSAVLSGGAILAACAPKPAPTAVPAAATAVPAAATAVPAAPAAAKTAEEILTPLNMMPGSPDKPKGWKTTLPDIPEGMPLDPPVEITSFTRTDADTKFQGNDTIYDNISLRYIKALFGIQYKIPWTYVTGDELNQKMNLATASGDLPELMPGIGLPIYQDLLEGELLADITDAFEQAASQKWVKEPLEYGDHMLWEYAEVDGRKMAFPSIAQAGQDEQTLWYRVDWVEKVGGKGAPTTLDEMEEVCEAIVKANLGAGPEGTTQGVMASKNLQSWYGGLGPVFGGFGVLPSWYTNVSTFTPDGQGGLVFNSILPAMKDALTLVRRWYEKKILASDFYTKDYQENRTDVEGNRVGMNFTHPWGGVVASAQGSIANDPSAKWAFADVPAGPVRKGKNYFSPLRQGVFVFKKGFQHMDKVFKQANYEAEIVLSPERRDHGFEGHNYVWEGDKVKTLSGGTHGYGIIKTRGGDNVSPESNMIGIKFRQNYKNTAPREKWDAWMELQLEDPTGLMSMMDEGWVFQAEHSLADTIPNLYTGAPTELQKERWPGLVTLTDEYFFAIITGQKPLDAFDEYVKTWKAQGGDVITQEINEWYAKKK
jgi:putative aldouronate transport system substrate-binding protein